jgi:hypothetical protein
MIFSSSEGEKMPSRASRMPGSVEMLIPLLQYPEARAGKVASNFSAG